MNVVDDSFTIPEAPEMTFEEEMKGDLPFVSYFS